MNIKRPIWHTRLALALCLWGAFASLPHAHADDIRQVTLTANDLVYDPGTQKIYASVPSSVGSSGNSITSIDPVTGTVGASVFVGSEPNKLAISDDNQFLYVGLDGASAVRRFDLATQTATLQFSIGTPLHVEDLAVPPGLPHSVCVVQEDPRYSPHYAGTVLYDDGVARTDRSNGQDSIAFSATADVLYGYNNSDTQFDFDKIVITATGPGGDGGFQNNNLISGGGLSIKFSEGKIFVNNGEVIDPVAQSILGTFSNTGYGSTFAVQPGDGRAFFVTFSGSTATLHAYDPNTFLQTGTLDIPNVPSTPESLIRWGSNGLAFRCSDQVFLIRTSLVPSSPPTWTATSVSAGANGSSCLLWNKSDGSAAVWKLNAQGQFAANVQYGPYTGWKAQMIATGKNNTTHLLWTQTDGTASVYLLDANNHKTNQVQYGPYAGWTAKALAVAPDNTVRLLWTNTDGTARLCTLDSTNHQTSQTEYGPYTDWTAQSVTVGSDGLTRLLWTNTDGTASLWKLNAQSQLAGQQQFGPYTGWTAQQVAAAPNGTFRLIWRNTDGHISLWMVNTSGQMTKQFQYGPYDGWNEQALAVDSDGNARLPWANTSGKAALWSLKPDGSFASNYQFGPY